MVLPSNFKGTTLYPTVIIRDNTGTEKYTFKSKRLFPAFDNEELEITDIALNIGQNAFTGSLVVAINDHSNALTDTTDPRRPSKILPEWSIELFLNATTPGGDGNRWFYGKIKDATVHRGGTNLQTILLTCLGWGVVLTERMTKLVRNQKKDEVIGDGETLDDTDTEARLDELIKDLFEDVDHYLDDNIPALANFTVASTTDGTGICSDCLTTKLANTNFTISTIAQALSTLVNIGNSTWQIDAERRVIIHDPSAHDSGFLFSNDLATTGTTANWNNNKLGYLSQSPLIWTDTSIDTYYNLIHGFGHFNPTLSASMETTPDAANKIDALWIAIPFTIEEDNIFKVAIRSIKVGTPDGSLSFSIWGQNASSDPNPSDIRRVIELNKTTLQALGTSTPALWFEIPISPKLDIEPGENLYLVFKKFGTSANTISTNYKSGTGGYEDSADGITWTPRTGDMAYRIYTAKRLTTTLESTEATRLLPETRERLFPIRANLEERTVRDTMINAGKLLAKKRRIYEKLMVYPTVDKIPIGQFCRVIDTKTNLNIKANIVALRCAANADDDLGFNMIELELDDFHY